MQNISKAAVLLIAFSSCGDATGPEAEWPSVPDVRPYVVGAAAAALDENGHFRLTPSTHLAQEPIISSEKAGELAFGYLRTYILSDAPTLPGTTGLRETLETLHGHPVRWGDARLVPQGPYFAETFVEPLPAEVPGYVRRYIGPHYLVPFHVDGDHIATIRVSALAHDAYIDEDGYVVVPPDPTGGGEEFSQSAPRHSWGHSFPPSAELAVQFAAESTETRIAEVPRLIKPGHHVMSFASYWMLILDRPVTLSRLIDGESWTTDTVYVRNLRSIIERVSRGEHLRLFVADHEQPDSLVARYRDGEGNERELRIARREGLPVNYREVAVQ